MPSPASAFEFAQPERIVFGPGVVSRAGILTASLGNSALLVTGRDVRRAEPVRESLRSAGLNWVEWAVAGEPTVSEVRAGAEAARSLGVDCVVACGGGSVLDAGKAISALTPQTGDVFRFLEIIGLGLPLENQPLPFLAMPTTAGTGAARKPAPALPGDADHRRDWSRGHAERGPYFA